MNSRYALLSLLLCSVLSLSAQWRPRIPRLYYPNMHRTDSNMHRSQSDFVKKYTDSLTVYRQRLDSLGYKEYGNSAVNDIIGSNGNIALRTSVLFMPMTYYKSPANSMLRLSENRSDDILSEEIEGALMNVYLKRPDMVVNKESELKNVASGVDVQSSPLSYHPDIVEKVAPVPVEPEVVPINLVVKKPNFWTFSGDYYLQFLQNYVSDNWYKGGESNYSMVGSVTLQANYNNKQKVKWDNKLELKLGYQTTSGDTLHNYKASSDLIRYTGKLGLQATKKWYYTLQVIASTQFTHGVKNNDPMVYSDFMSPMTLNPSLGMDYTMEWFKKKLTGSVHIAPLALNFKYVDRLGLSTRYGLDEGSHTLVDYGSELTVDLTWKFTDNIKWKSRLYGYTTYKRAEVEWENTFTFQFNKYISTNIFVYPRFDDGTSRDESHGYWQLKEYASIGFSYSF